MALLDALSRDEASFFTELIKRQVDIFNRDFDLLFNGKVKVAQSSFGHLVSEKIIESLTPASALMIMRWEGDCTGDVITVLTSTEVKILRGFLMMMQASAIEEALKSDLIQEEKDAFKEIATQINTSHENAMHEILTIDFRSTLKSVEFLNAATSPDAINEIFSDTAYLLHSSVLKMADFEDGSITQYYPLLMMQKVFTSEKVGEATQGNTSKKGAKTILIINKDLVTRNQIKGSLNHLELNIIEADDGIKAFQLLMRMDVDLVLLDVEVPQMRELEICKRMRANPRMENIPVIACSEKCSKTDVVNALSHGARDFVVNPSNNKKIIQQKIKQYISVE